MRIHLLRDFKRARTYKKYFRHITPISTIAKTREIKFWQLRRKYKKSTSFSLERNFAIQFLSDDKSDECCMSRSLRVIQNCQMKC